ncbi:GATOR complex protein MIOS-B [Ischnura elegans]|uniref:GATOR complex protein MIOS-B n=1 Tax=Ischnura elegans TaxID=197161 RepID=UPI001ED870EC|nr:GATOR complex protein MIOS-B [Ischnura elegans]
MSGIKLEVQWSPVNQDKFIIWGNDIFLYEVSPCKDPLKPSCVRISEHTVAHLLASNTNQHYVKCIDIHPHPETDILLAIGQANGKVVLTSFGSTSFDSRGLIGKEFAPKHARQCNALQWNPSEVGLLAVGLDKHRGDHSVLLWDVVNGPMGGGSGDGFSAKPLQELGLSETAHSLAWIAQTPRNLALGMNHKHLKLFDLRDTTKPVNSTPTKAVFGLIADPHSEHHLASYVEGQISIWDLRNFEKPILTLSQSKPFTKLSWSPTRRNLLGSLTRDSSYLYLYDIQHAVVGSADGPEPAIAIERNVNLEPQAMLASFSWHPSHENRLLAITSRGKISDYTVIERITLNWSPSSKLIWTYGRQTLRYMNETDPAYACLDDISVKIKERAMNDYGLKQDLWQNADLVAEDEGLKKLWHWLNTNQALMGDEVNCRVVKHPGVRAILKMGPYQSNGTLPKSEMNCVPWSDLGPSCQSAVRIYRSEERERALQLCGWRFERWWLEGATGTPGNMVSMGNSLNSFLDRLEAEEEGSHTRVAAIAIFNLRIRLAIQVLNGGASAAAASAAAMNNPRAAILEGNNLNIVAMALSGYTGDKNSIWRELCLVSRNQLLDPYLRAIFAFLTADGDNYESVLNESGMAVEDRVAFACMYLSDSKLNEYLERLTYQLTEEGDLGGILLTGTSEEGLDLLQRYVDRTGDVQSVSCLAICAFSVDLIKNQKVQEWLESYRSLLDSWRMWNQRAQFDVALGARNSADKPPQQVFLSCNFCGKSVSMYMQGINRNRGQYGRLGGTSNKHKISSCPNCRKPLPRCAICLINMGTPSGFLTQQRLFSDERIGGDVAVSTAVGNVMMKEKRLSEFSSWFTWCQTCRHGGHATHMSQWFKLHAECPVTGCTCRCMSLDAVVRLGSVPGKCGNKI